MKNHYLLFLINKALDRLSWAKYFIQLDLTSTYHRMRIQESKKQKTVFHIKYSYFKYQDMSCGLFNIPTSFQGYINKIFIEKFDVFVIIYLDNILIYTKESN